jgi:hypothetical protein
MTRTQVDKYFRPTVDQHKMGITKQLCTTFASSCTTLGQSYPNNGFFTLKTKGSDREKYKYLKPNRTTTPRLWILIKFVPSQLAFRDISEFFYFLQTRIYLCLLGIVLYEQIHTSILHTSLEVSAVILESLAFYSDPISLLIRFAYKPAFFRTHPSFSIYHSRGISFVTV